MGCALRTDCSGARELIPRGAEDGEDRSPLLYPAQYAIRLHKGSGDAIGASFGNPASALGAVLYCVQEGGLLDRWNKENPDRAVRPGFIVAEVNGVTGGYWTLLEELRRPGPLDIKISTVPPKSAGPRWFENIAAMGRKMELEKEKGSPAMFRPTTRTSQDENNSKFISLPSVVASTAGVEQCAICFEDVGPDEVLAQFPCKHCFHHFCITRWLSQSSSRRASEKHTCPLCCRKLFGIPEGVAVVRPLDSGSSWSPSLVPAQAAVVGTRPVPATARE